jgi:hypothetical protein
MEKTMKLNSYSQEQMDKIDAMTLKLSEELKKGHSEYFKEYLKVASKFHKYSFGNQMLILSQKPTATKVASYDDWKNNFNRQVKKGAKGIKILVPVFKKMEVENGGVKEEEKRLVSYRVGNVFDISDTEGDEVPQFFYGLGDEYAEMYETLKGIIQKEGVNVVEENTGKAMGSTNGKEIKIHPEQDGNNKFLTLIHEVAHTRLHFGPDRASLTTGLKECQAEAVAYVVAAYFGLESPISADYLLNWGNDSDTLKANLKPVIRASQTIINQLIQEQDVSGSNNNQETVA